MGVEWVRVVGRVARPAAMFVLPPRRAYRHLWPPCLASGQVCVCVCACVCGCVIVPSVVCVCVCVCVCTRTYVNAPSHMCCGTV